MAEIHVNTRRLAGNKSNPCQLLAKFLIEHGMKDCFYTSQIQEDNSSFECRLTTLNLNDLTNGMRLLYDLKTAPALRPDLVPFEVTSVPTTVWFEK